MGGEAARSNPEHTDNDSGTDNKQPTVSPVASATPLTESEAIRKDLGLDHNTSVDS